jgi:hypothetical protein
MNDIFKTIRVYTSERNTMFMRNIKNKYDK